MSTWLQELWKQQRPALLLSILYLVYLLALCNFMLHNWHGMDEALRVEAAGIAIFSAALWSQLFKDRASWLTMAMACFLFVAASQIVFRLF